MVVNERPLKRRRRITANYYDFFTFPAVGDEIFGAPFRSAIPCFLSRHARPAFPLSSLFPSLMTWQILFRASDSLTGDDGAGVVTLYVVEEDVTRSSRSVYCDQCRVVGWSGHPVCRKRYHFIIRSENSNGISTTEDVEERPRKACGNMLNFLDSRCNSCNFITNDDNIEVCVYHQLDDTTHLLHGVVHSNGYGHLTTLNGREGGSESLSGSDIMNFWDRLCQTLAVRKISVMDVSKKYGMEYRLLHAITNAHPWYGNWGYEYGTGSYAITPDAYRDAVASLSALPMSLFSYHGRSLRTRLQELIEFYQSLSDSQLVTLKDLLSFMLLLIHKSRRTSKPGLVEKAVCSIIGATPWSTDDIKQVEQALIKVLLVTAGDARWVSRRALKGAISRTASPELIDYCLKHLGGKLASNGVVVNTRCNSSSLAIEFRLEPLGSVISRTTSHLNQLSEEQLIRDLKYLYDSILHPKTMTFSRSPSMREMVINSATRILDCKHFVKNYKPGLPETTTPLSIYLWCHVELADHSKDDPTPPPELMVLPENVSVADLKLEATKAFQEVYAIFKRFEAEEVLDFGPLDDSMTLKLLVGSRGSVRVQGRCPGTHGLGRYRMERGMENWIVDCVCGAKDDDGERMLACDKCGTWQHTRCAAINDFDAVPVKFVCTRCLNPPLEESRHDGHLSDVVAKIMPSRKGRTCRAAVGKSKSSRNRSSFTQSFGVR